MWWLLKFVCRNNNNKFKGIDELMFVILNCILLHNQNDVWTLPKPYFRVCCKNIYIIDVLLHSFNWVFVSIKISKIKKIDICRYWDCNSFQCLQQLLVLVGKALIFTIVHPSFLVFLQLIISNLYMNRFLVQGTDQSPAFVS